MNDTTIVTVALDQLQEHEKQHSAGFKLGVLDRANSFRDLNLLSQQSAGQYGGVAPNIIVGGSGGKAP